MLLTSENISSFSKEPLRLTSTFAEGKVLVVNPYSEVVFRKISDFSFDRWKFLSVDQIQGSEKEWIIVSERGMLCHNLSDGGNIHLRPLLSPEEKSSTSTMDDCRWKIGSEGEIYQNHPQGGERYLWVANDRLYVTLDGYLAEKWIPVREGEKIPKSPPPSLPSNEKRVMMVMFVIVLTIVCLFLGYRIFSE